jgi:predicted GH43/DUF377 family glycosyl hydrolase
MTGLAAKLRLFAIFTVVLIGTSVLPIAHAASNAIQGRMVLGVGSPGAWDGFSVFRPSVIRTNSSYMMWYSGASIYVVDTIGFANSTDGISWKRYSQNPVLNVGNATSWDHGVKDPWVIHENGIYKMWYTGLLYMWYTKLIVLEQIGYATSPDGLNWTKYPGNPVLPYGPVGSLNDKWVFRPVVISTGSSYTMYYSSLSQTGTYGIGMATSNDGISWKKLDPVTMPSSGWDAYAASIGSVTEVGNRLLMAYAAQSNQGYPSQIGLANSTDGINWTTFSENPVISGSNSTWDNGASDPTIVRVGDHYNVYYTALTDNGTSTIALANLSTAQVSISEFPRSILPPLGVIALVTFSLLHRRFRQ